MKGVKECLRPSRSVAVKVNRCGCVPLAPKREDDLIGQFLIRPLRSSLQPTDTDVFFALAHSRSHYKLQLGRIGFHVAQ